MVNRSYVCYAHSFARRNNKRGYYGMHAYVTPCSLYQNDRAFALSATITTPFSFYVNVNSHSENSQRSRRSRITDSWKKNPANAIDFQYSLDKPSTLRTGPILCNYRLYANEVLLCKNAWMHIHVYTCIYVYIWYPPAIPAINPRNKIIYLV